MSITVGQAKAQLASIEQALADTAGLKAKVESSFKNLDQNSNNVLDKGEIMVLVQQLCAIMNLPAPEAGDFVEHKKLLDQNKDSVLDINEVGSGIVGALIHKAQSLKHYLAFAQRDNLGDDKELPHQ